MGESPKFISCSARRRFAATSLFYFFCAMQSVQTNPTGGKKTRPTQTGISRKPEPKEFPEIRELFGYWANSGPTLTELLPTELKAIVAGIGDRETFEEILWSMDAIRNLFCRDILNAPNANTESADYQAAARCFHAFNEFIGTVSSFDIVNAGKSKGGHNE